MPYLEGEMLQEVCCAIGLVCLCSRASIDPYADRRCLGPGRVFCSDLPAVSELLHLLIWPKANAYRETV